ncbi:hypothetical protein [Marinomonas spartinae]|nr:hypothetical protein [Marinomonas spartinae]
MKRWLNQVVHSLFVENMLGDVSESKAATVHSVMLPWDKGS